MRYDFDVAVIGLGPAGMAVSVMGAHMGLRVLGIEGRALGGECMNVGCIPSKALLRMAHVRNMVGRMETYGLVPVPLPEPLTPFRMISEHIGFITEKKTRKMFDQVTLVLGEGPASFVDPHTLRVGEGHHTAKRVFICTGTRPAVPPIPGLSAVPYLTNETVFDLEAIPERLVVIGGGAIGCELAQAFGRLGARVAVVHQDAHLLPHGDADAGAVLEERFVQEGVSVHNGRKIARVEQASGELSVHTVQGETLAGSHLLIAAGRRHDAGELGLDKAEIAHDCGRIIVDKGLRTSQRHIFAPGDVNGSFLFSHAAMHQGMLALMNAFLRWPFRLNFRRYVVPWTVFTEPQVAHVGMLERDLRARGTRYETVEERYADYGAAIAEGVAVGSVKAFVSRTGRIYGVRIIGEGAGEMINEWGLAIQNKLRMHKIMFLQHSFPSMSFLNKRVAEGWMMNRMRNPRLKALARRLF